MLQVSIKAADGEGVAVTGVMLWDGPIDGIATYDYITEQDWTKNICDCCLEVPIPEVCNECIIYSSQPFNFIHFVLLYDPNFVIIMLVLKNDSIHKGKKAKRQTMIGKTLHRKLKIEHIRNYKLSVPKSYKNNY